jgi:Domain of unknown function (DUF543)
MLAVIKVASGIAVGGVVGMILFRKKKPAAAPSIMTCVATGIGVAIGSSYERFKQKYSRKSDPALSPSPWMAQLGDFTKSVWNSSSSK